MIPKLSLGTKVGSANIVARHSSEGDPSDVLSAQRNPQQSPREESTGAATLPPISPRKNSNHTSQPTSQSSSNNIDSCLPRYELLDTEALANDPFVTEEVDALGSNVDVLRLELQAARRTILSWELLYEAVVEHYHNKMKEVLEPLMTHIDACPCLSNHATIVPVHDGDMPPQKHHQTLAVTGVACSHHGAVPPVNIHAVSYRSSHSRTGSMSSPPLSPRSNNNASVISHAPTYITTAPSATTNTSPRQQRTTSAQTHITMNCSSLVWSSAGGPITNPLQGNTPTSNDKISNIKERRASAGGNRSSSTSSRNGVARTSSKGRPATTPTTSSQCIDDTGATIRRTNSGSTSGRHSVTSSTGNSRGGNTGVINRSTSRSIKHNILASSTGSGVVIGSKRQQPSLRQSIGTTIAGAVTGTTKKQQQNITSSKNKSSRASGTATLRGDSLSRNSSTGSTTGSAAVKKSSSSIQKNSATNNSNSNNNKDILEQRRLLAKSPERCLPAARSSYQSVPTTVVASVSLSAPSATPATLHARAPISPRGPAAAQQAAPSTTTGTRTSRIGSPAVTRSSTSQGNSGRNPSAATRRETSRPTSRRSGALGNSIGPQTAQTLPPYSAPVAPTTSSATNRNTTRPSSASTHRRVQQTTISAQNSNSNPSSSPHTAPIIHNDSITAVISQQEAQERQRPPPFTRGTNYPPPPETMPRKL